MSAGDVFGVFKQPVSVFVGTDDYLPETHSVKKLRNEAFDKVSSLELAYFSDKRKGDIVSRITSDVLQVEMSVINTLTVVIKEPILLIVYVVFLFAMSVHLTLFTLLVLPISGLLISLIVKN
jgi:subfamily B ATP-binding cassette protein MsbA